MTLALLIWYPLPCCSTWRRTGLCRLDDVFHFSGERRDFGACPAREIGWQTGQEHFLVSNAFAHDGPEDRQALAREFLVSEVGHTRAKCGHFGEQQPVGNRSSFLFRHILDIGDDNEGLRS